MSRVVVSEFVSLDGVMEDPGGFEGSARGGWAFQFARGPEGDRFKLDELQAADALLLGRVTYTAFAQAWPGQTDESGFAEKMNSMPKYVVSSTLRDADAGWGRTTVIRGDVTAEIARLRSQPGGDLLVAGSCRLANTLVEHGLVDEYRLMVYPIIVGGGKRLFEIVAAATPLTLTDARQAGSGIMMLCYGPTAAKA